ncbi:hypothetical protein [Streptomyces collinus]|uniref:hypothetical protein n=1 Tax=Streptomyces collinus TaxID=42684 RepID=UPI00332F5AFB
MTAETRQPGPGPAVRALLNVTGERTAAATVAGAEEACARTDVIVTATTARAGSPPLVRLGLALLEKRDITL